MSSVLSKGIITDVTTNNKVKLRNKTINCVDNNTLQNIPYSALSAELKAMVGNVGGNLSNSLQSQIDAKANISYVDQNINSNVSILNNSKLDKTGGTISNDLTVTGNLIVNGSSTTVNTTNLEVGDNLVSIAKNNNVSDSVSIGQFGQYQNKYAGIFRNHTTKDWEFFHELTLKPDGLTVNTGDASYKSANIKCDNITTNGLRNSTSLPLNVGVGVLSKNYTFGTSTINADSSRIINVADAIGSNDAVTLQQMNNTISSTISSASFYPLTGGNINGSVTVNGGLTVSGINKLSTTFLQCPTSSGISVLHTNGTDNLFNITTTKINSYLGQEIAGLGCGTNGFVNAVGIVNGNVSGLSRTHYIYKIDTIDGSSQQVLRNITVSTSLAYQHIRLFNNTSMDIYITSGNGNIRCLPQTVLARFAWLELVYDVDNNLFYVMNQNIHSVLNRHLYYRWRGDRLLTSLLNSSGSYPVLVNFNNSVDTTINSLSFTNISATSTQTNYTVTFTGTVSNDVGAGPRVTFLSDTESNKFRGLLYSFTDYTLTINSTALTVNNYYQLMIFYLDWNGDQSRRSALIQDLDINPGFQLYHEGQPYANEGVIVSYIFQYSHKTNVRFRLTNVSAIHIYGLAVRNLGSSLGGN